MIANGPNHTIAQTLYSSGELAGNRSNPIVLYTSGNSSSNDSMSMEMSANMTKPIVIQQPTQLVNITAGPLEVENFQVYIIDAVLSLPPTLGEAATELLPSLAGVAQQAELLPALEAAEGLTIFAPNDQAFADLGDAANELSTEQLQAILANHAINGTAVYSSQLAETEYVSAGGQPFMFTSNSSGTYVMSGDASAKVLMTDLTVSNGVVHVIDAVLVNLENNSGAAASAASSYEAVATATSTSSGANGLIGVNTAAAAEADVETNATTEEPENAAGRLTPLFGSAAAVVGGVILGAACLF